MRKGPYIEVISEAPTRMVVLIKAWILELGCDDKKSKVCQEIDYGLDVSVGDINVFVNEVLHDLEHLGLVDLFQ
mgnify:CR=1 FL=1